MDLVFLYVTAASLDEAQRIGRAIVEAELAACANILDGMQSIYRWQGEVQEGSEAVLILKTRASLVERATAAIKEAHSYETPCIVALPIVGGDAAYLDWIAAESNCA